MIATLRHRLIAVLVRVLHDVRALVLRLPSDEQWLPEILTRVGALPTSS